MWHRNCQIVACKAIVWSSKNKARIMLEILGSWRCQSCGLSDKKSWIKGIKSPRERLVLQSAKVEGWCRVLWHQIWSYRSWPCWGLVQSCFWSSISSLCPLSSLLECYCTFCATICWKYVICFLILHGVTMKRFNLRRDFGHFNSVGTVKDYGDFRSWTTFILIMIWPQAYEGQGVECDGLIENDPRRLI